MTGGRRARRDFATPRRMAVLTVVIVLLASSAVPGYGQEAAEQAAEDAGQKRSGEGKSGQSGFLPIPIFITEPAVGAGFGVTLAYIHPRTSSESEESSPPLMAAGSAGHVDEGQKRPPDISGVVGAYTENGTWLAGLGHSASWSRDRIRYAGAAAYGNINATSYLLGRAVDFELEGWTLYQDVKFRLGSSKIFLGGKLSYLDTTSKFKLDLGEGVDIPLGSTRDSGLAAQVYYEGRDNVFTPNRGQLFQGLVWRYDEALGGDFDYWKVGLKLTSFHPLGDRFVLGWRVNVDAVDGDPPFWGYPWITLRGVPAMRYQNRRTAVVEVEGRWTICDHWGVVGFVGTGSANGDDPAFENRSGIVAGGVGGRFLFKPELGLWVGVDVARGPERTAFYIQVGQAW